MLERNFDGRHFYIPAQNDGNKIDSMFFPASSEKIFLKSEINKGINVSEL